MKTITYNPETHVLVPVEPSGEMCDAANKIDDEMYCGGSQHGADIDQVYYAMIAAAPQPEPEEVKDAALVRELKSIRQALIGWRQRSWPGIDQTKVVDRDFPLIAAMSAELGTQGEKK